MNLPDPKICIVFNSGSCGDFLAALISQQLDATDITINTITGAAENIAAQEFKEAAKEYYKSKFNPDKFNNVANTTVVNTHYCGTELMNLFPNCKFYYIDDSEFIDESVQVYIKKRVTTKYDSLLDWFHNFPNVFTHITSRIKNIDEEKILQFMRRDWHRNVTVWKQLGIPAIALRDVVGEKSCKQIVKNIIQSEVDEFMFTASFTNWAEKNKELIEQISEHK